MQCVILAGGLGTRMWPEAQERPKTLLPVGGRPFADWQLRWLADAGIDSVVYCVGYLGSMIREHIGDGHAWGLAVRYVDEGEQRRGTAGAVRLAYDHGLLDDTFLVLYGDSWLQVDPGEVLREARTRPEPALMTAYRNNGRWDASNVVFDGRRVTRYAKGLSDPPPEMAWIDYGLLALRSELVGTRLPPGEVCDLAPLCSALADEGQLAGFEVTERFYEIGSPAGRAELDTLLSSRAY
jgi:NDP-sugar pyrophosphorylase family protein